MPSSSSSRSSSPTARTGTIKENRVAAAQVLSGTGGLRVCAQLIERLPRLTGSSQKPVCYMPEPTWGNHAKVFQDAGVEVRRYRYLDSNTKTTLDYEGMKEDLMKAEKALVSYYTPARTTRRASTRRRTNGATYLPH